MEFLKNIKKDFILSKEYKLIEEEYSITLKDYIPKDITIRVVDMNIDVIDVMISDISELGDISKKISDSLIENLTIEFDDVTKTVLKILDAWENMPDKFIKVERATDVYEFKGLIQRSKYYEPVNIHFEKLNFYFNVNYPGGYGENTFKNKDVIKESFQNLEPWFKKSCKDLKSSAILKRIENYISKKCFSIPIEDFIKYVSIPETEIKTNKIEEVKPEFPISFSGEELNGLLYCFDSHVCIDEEFVEEVRVDCQIDISVLLGWEITEGSEGYHHTDSDHCDYEICFSTPDGKHEYSLTNSHCLMTGYNFHGDSIIPK